MLNLPPPQQPVSREPSQEQPTQAGGQPLDAVSLPAPPVFDGPVLVTTAFSQLVAVTTSGQEVVIAKVSLWPHDLLSNVRALLAAAATNKQGYSTGIGFIGDFGSVMARSAALGVVENLISSRMNWDATVEEAKAMECFQRAKHESWMFPVNTINGISDPDPLLWYASYGWQQPGTVRRFVHSGQRFVTVATASGDTRTLVWSSVEQVYTR